LVNRTKPRVYCILNRKDRFWLEWMTKTGRVQSTKDVADAFALLARYRSEVQGVVVTDPALPATRNVATMAAGVLDGAIESPRLAARLGLPVLADLRGRWRKSAYAYRWAYDSLWDRMSHRVAACIWPTDPGLRDYLIQHRLPVFWLPGRIDGAKPYADAAAEMHVMEQMLARMPANVPAMGLPWAGENVGMGEQPGVSLLAEFGKYVVASVGLSNASVHSGYPTPAFRQHRSAAPRLDPTRIYLSFLISDGDNLGCLEIGNWPDMWSGTSRGSIQAGWTISPSAAALLPDIVDYYYSVATPNDQFVAAVSGVGYTYPELYGKRYRQPSAVYRGFLDQTNRTMRGMDLVTVNPTGAGDRQIAGYAERVAGLKGIFADYGRTVGTYAEATVVTTGNVPVFHGVTSWVADGDREAQITHMVDQIREIAPSAGPGFLHAFACNWFYDLPALQEVMRRLGPRFVVVLPEHLAALCRQDMERRQVSVSIPETLCAIEGSTTRIPVSVRNLSSRPQSVRLSLSPGGGHGVVEPGRLTVKPAQEVEAAVTGVTSGKRVEVRASGAFGIRSCASTMLITPRSELCTGPSLPRTRFVSLFEAEGLPHIVGSEAADPAASGGRVRAAVKGETQPGFLVHGPYRSFTAGWYVALFRLKRTGHGSGPTCVLDAIVAGGSWTLKVRTVSAGDLPVGKWRAVPVEFVHSGGPLETRVNWTGGASMIVDRVEVYRVR
jgi:hypothetical protein